MTQFPVVEDNPDLPPLTQPQVQPGLVVAHQPDDVSPREVVGDKEESVVDNTYKHEAEAVQEVIYEVIEATSQTSSKETWYEILHGRSYPCHIFGKTYKRAHQLSANNMLSDRGHSA